MNSILKYAIGLSVATVFGGAVVASPAQAGLVGSLAFSDGTDNWFSEVTGNAGDTFSVEFNPLEFNFVSTADGYFTPPFNGDLLQGVAPYEANFEWVSGSSATGFTYALTNDLVFAFDNGASVTWKAGNLFDGVFTGTGNSVEFYWQPNQPLDQIQVAGIGETGFDTFATAFEFADTIAPGGGTYLAQVDIASTPEPTTLFGLGVVTAGLVTSRRKKSS